MSVTPEEVATAMKNAAGWSVPAAKRKVHVPPPPTVKGEDVNVYLSRSEDPGFLCTIEVDDLLHDYSEGKLTRAETLELRDALTEILDRSALEDAEKVDELLEAVQAARRRAFEGGPFPTRGVVVSGEQFETLKRWADIHFGRGDRPLAVSGFRFRHRGAPRG